MRSLHIAWSLIRIPHLALSLFAFPLLIGLVIVGIQSFVTAIIVTAASRDKTVEYATSGKGEQSVTRFVLFGNGDRRPPPVVCRWVESSGAEVPPNADCSPDRLDVALQVANPESFGVESYVKMFAGNVDRIHVCRDCAPDVVIRPTSGSTEASVHTHSIFGALLALSPFWNDEVNKQRAQAFQAKASVRKTLGTYFLHLPESPEGIRLLDMGTSLPVALNVTLFVIVALWLALRAHRRVLDYFARNDVLLPLVASCGKSSFYGALWILTGLRVASFLISGLILVVLGFREILMKGAKPLLHDGLETGLLWLLALIATLGLATLLASIAELKHRQNILTSLLKYVPIVLAVLGGLVWMGTLLVQGELSSNVRTVIAAIPVVGMIPILIAPILDISPFILALHGAVALMASVFIARANTRWFAAHLDEL